MSNPQFPKRTTLPLRPDSYRALARKLRRFADDLDARAEPTTTREKMALTRIIHSLCECVRVLRLRHDKL